jgi:predicted RNA-binding Zn-ribbon protein involved in translation (DUF1610 family)
MVNRTHWKREGISPVLKRMIASVCPPSPEGVPPAYWASIGWYRDVSTLAGFVLAPSVLLYVLLARSTLWTNLFFLCGSLLVWFTPRFAARRWRRRLAECDFQVCLQCGYDLRHLETHRCPECGVRFEPRAVSLRWREWAAKRTGR